MRRFLVLFFVVFAATLFSCKVVNAKEYGYFVPTQKAATAGECWGAGVNTYAIMNPDPTTAIDSSIQTVTADKIKLNVQGPDSSGNPVTKFANDVYGASSWHQGYTDYCAPSGTYLLATTVDAHTKTDWWGEPLGGPGYTDSLSLGGPYYGCAFIDNCDGDYAVGGSYIYGASWGTNPSDFGIKIYLTGYTTAQTANPYGEVYNTSTISDRTGQMRTSAPYLRHVTSVCDGGISSGTAPYPSLTGWNCYATFMNSNLNMGCVPGCNPIAAVTIPNAVDTGSGWDFWYFKFGDQGGYSSSYSDNNYIRLATHLTGIPYSPASSISVLPGQLVSFSGAIRSDTSIGSHDISWARFYVDGVSQGDIWTPALAAGATSPTMVLSNISFSGPGSAHTVQLCGDVYANVINEDSSNPNRCMTWNITVSWPAPTCSSTSPNGVVIQQTSGGYNIYALGVANATNVVFPTWSNANGQDDLIWYTGTNLGGGTWYATINMDTHTRNPYPGGANDPNIGAIYTPIYVANPSSGWVWCATNTIYVYNPNLQPTALTATTSNGTVPGSFAVSDDVYVFMRMQNVGGYQSTTGSSNSSYADIYEDSGNLSTPSYSFPEPSTINAGQVLYFCSWLSSPQNYTYAGVTQLCYPPSGGPQSWKAKNPGSSSTLEAWVNHWPAPNKSTEYTFADNTMTASYPVQAPDLQVTSLQTVDGSGNPKGSAGNPFSVGEPIYLDTTITNTGSVGMPAMGGIVTQFYHNLPGTAAVGQIGDSSATDNSAIGSGSSISYNPSWTMSAPSPAGTPYAARAFANYVCGQAGAPVESDCTNNQAVVPYVVAYTKTMSLTSGIMPINVSVGDTGTAPVNIIPADGTFDKWQSGNTLQANVTKMCGPSGACVTSGNTIQGMVVKYLGGASCNTTACTYTIPSGVPPSPAPAGNMQLQADMTNAVPGTYTIYVTGSSPYTASVTGTNPLVITFNVAYRPFIQVGVVGGGAFTGDVHSNGTIDLDDRAGQTATPMNRFFANGVAGVVSAKGTISNHGYSFFSGSTSWLASGYTPAITPTSDKSLHNSIPHTEDNLATSLLTGLQITSQCLGFGPPYSAAEFKPSSGNTVSLNGWGVGGQPNCKVVLIGDFDSSSHAYNLRITGNIHNATGHPLVFIITGDLLIDDNVSQIDGFFIFAGGLNDDCDHTNSLSCSASGMSNNPLIVNGSLIGIADACNSAYANPVKSHCGLVAPDGTSAFKRQPSSPQLPAETINYDPQYLDVLRGDGTVVNKLLGVSAYSWTEDQ